MKQCPSCNRQLDDHYQFCPYDRTALGRTCRTCGKVWDTSFQFCPLDSTELGEALAAPSPEPPLAGEPEPPPPPPAPPPPEVPLRVALTMPPPPPEFSFTEQVAGHTWKKALFRPMSLIFIVGILAVGAFVYFLTEQTGGSDLPLPVVTYELLPNEGKSRGVPVAIKVNQLAVFLVDDPMEEGAKRSQQIVSAIEEILHHAQGDVGLRFAVETKDGRPTVLVVTQAGPDPRVLASVTEGDVALSGETDGTRVAARWAERLTDAVKLFVFGEAPTFSKGTEFGDILFTLYKSAADAKGRLSKKSLERAFQQLTPAQRQALETPPRVQ